MSSFAQFSNIKPSTDVSDWVSDEPRYRAAMTAKNVQTYHL